METIYTFLIFPSFHISAQLFKCHNFRPHNTAISLNWQIYWRLSWLPLVAIFFVSEDRQRWKDAITGNQRIKRNFEERVSIIPPGWERGGRVLFFRLKKKITVFSLLCSRRSEMTCTFIFMCRANVQNHFLLFFFVLNGDITICRPARPIN